MKTYNGIEATEQAWHRLGIIIGSDGRPSYDSDRNFGVLTGQRYGSLDVLLPSLIARAVDALPDGVSGDKILARVATLAGRDKTIAALGKFGEKIPSNINIWHHLRELRLEISDSK